MLLPLAISLLKQRSPRNWNFSRNLMLGKGKGWSLVSTRRETCLTTWERRLGLRGWQGNARSGGWRENTTPWSEPLFKCILRSQPWGWSRVEGHWAWFCSSSQCDHINNSPMGGGLNKNVSYRLRYLNTCSPTWGGCRTFERWSLSRGKCQGKLWVGNTLWMRITERSQISKDWVNDQAAVMWSNWDIAGPEPNYLILG